MKKTTIFLVLLISALAVSPVLADDITWALGTVSIDSDMQDDIETLLLATPPEDATTLIYAVTDATSSDGDWMISIANLDGVAPPYEEWSWEENAVWGGGVVCTGTDPDWDCEYFEPEPIGGSGSLLFPWRLGTRAIYGVMGVHDGVQTYMPESMAVDFVGGDSLGTSIMPPYVYAVESGTVTYVCRDEDNIGIRITGANVFGYLHFAPTTVIELGDTFSAGEQIGILAYGPFENNCGWASQGPDQYHLHFSFYPDADGYLSIGGCLLNTTTENWLCGTNTVGIRGLIPNGTGGTSATTPGDTGTTPTSFGGEHLWDGIVYGIVDAARTFAVNTFPEHTAAGIESAMTNGVMQWMNIVQFIDMSGLIWLAPVFIIIGIMLAIEIVRWSYVVYRLIIRLIPMP